MKVDLNSSSIVARVRVRSPVGLGSGIGLWLVLVYKWGRLRERQRCYIRPNIFTTATNIEDTDGMSKHRLTPYNTTASLSFVGRYLSQSISSAPDRRPASCAH